MKTSIISVAAYVKDDEVRKVVLKSDNIRSRTIEKCYTIPGYAELSLEEKNALYDKVRMIVEKEIEKETTK